MRSRGDPQSGSMMVEAAFTSIVLFIFLLGIMEAARFFQVQAFLTEAAHEGARVAVKPLSGRTDDVLPDDDEVYRTVNELLSAGAIYVQPDDVGVQCVALDDFAPITNCALSCPEPCGTRVTVTWTYQVISLAMFRDLEIPVRGTAVMRNETSPTE